MALRKILDSAEHPSSCSSACQVWRFVLPSWALHRILGLQQGLNLLRMQQAWTGHVTQIMIWPLDSKKSKCWQCWNMLEPQAMCMYIYATPRPIYHLAIQEPQVPFWSLQKAGNGGISVSHRHLAVAKSQPFGPTLQPLQPQLISAICRSLLGLCVVAKETCANGSSLNVAASKMLKDCTFALHIGQYWHIVNARKIFGDLHSEECTLQDLVKIVGSSVLSWHSALDSRECWDKHSRRSYLSRESRSSSTAGASTT